MLIRGPQMDALSEDRARKFESDVADHLKRCFPAECARLGEGGLRGLIRYGIERARTHEITAAREVCLYLDVIMVHGRDFDRSQNWASEILRDKRWKDPATRVDQLYRAAKEHAK